MTIGTTRPSISWHEITDKISEANILGYYLGITHIPCVIQSPLRKDEHPSFRLYSPNGRDVNYLDYSTGEGGSCAKLLDKMWNMRREKVYSRILKDFPHILKGNTLCQKSREANNVFIDANDITLECKVREWREYDIEYWKSFGIPIEILKWAEVYPISHKLITKNGVKFTFPTDKYAYTFVERKEGKVSHKFYQPFNINGYKWQNNHDKSVLGLWTKMPEKGSSVCICSSVKDALCLISNMHIPSICLQGEGFPISDTALRELRRRFTNIYLCLDNDATGLDDAQRLSAKHSLINVVIPQFDGGKDIADYYHVKGKDSFIETFNRIFSDAYYYFYQDELF